MKTEIICGKNKKILSIVLVIGLVLSSISLGLANIEVKAVAYGTLRISVRTAQYSTSYHGHYFGETEDNVYCSLYSGANGTGKVVYSAYISEGPQYVASNRINYYYDVPIDASVGSVSIVKHNNYSGTSDDWSCDYWLVYYTPPNGNEIFLGGEDSITVINFTDETRRFVNVTNFPTFNPYAGTIRINVCTRFGTTTDTGITKDGIICKFYSGSNCTGRLLYQTDNLKGPEAFLKSVNNYYTDFASIESVRSVEISKPNGTDGWGCAYWYVYYTPLNGSEELLCGEKDVTFLTGSARCINIRYVSDPGNRFNYNPWEYNPSIAIDAGNYCNLYFDGVDQLKGQLKYDGYKILCDNTVEKDTNVNGVGYIIAHKKVNNGENLFLVIVQGTVDRQWQGNFDITGTSYDSSQTDHYSFKTAKDTVKTGLISELNKKSGSNQLLITGHSRGAAVANLLAKDMTELLGSYNITKVFGYTFATPNVTLNPVYYSNIYNFCFTDDFVCLSPLPKWGYDKHGVTLWATAEDLYNQGGDFQLYMDALGTNGFNKKRTQDFADFVGYFANTTDAYYSRFFYYFELIRSLHATFREIVAPVVFESPSAWSKANFASLAIGNSIEKYIFWYFWDGNQNYIRHTHSAKTYYCALLTDGFYGKGVKNTAAQFEKSVADNPIKTTGGKDVSNPNMDEVNRLKVFAQHGENNNALQWNLDDPSTWDGITWTDGTENRVAEINLPGLGLEGMLDLGDFNRLTDVNVSANMISGVNLSNCSSLVNLNLSINSLTDITADNLSQIKQIDCRLNSIESLNIANCDALESLLCGFNNLGSLDLSGLDALSELDCENNQLEDLNVSNNTALTVLRCAYNCLDIQQGSETYESIQSVAQRVNAKVSYKPQRAPEAAIFNQNDLLKLTAFAQTDTNIDKLAWDLEKPREWYGVGWTLSGSEYRVEVINMSSLDLSGSLNLSGFSCLKTLDCSNNDLTGLVLEGCTQLKSLRCANASLTSLSISDSNLISVLRCENNYLNTTSGTELRNTIDLLNPAMDNLSIVYEPQMVMAPIDSFYASDYNALLQFAQAGNNSDLLNWEVGKPGEWPGVKWKNVSGVYRVEELLLNQPGVSGNLAIQALNALDSFDCSNSDIVSVALPNNIKRVEDYAFSGCSELLSITIPDGVETLGAYSFSDCSNLNSVTIGSSMQLIGKMAFSGCDNLMSIAVSAGNQNYSSSDGVLFNKALTVLERYPAGLESTQYIVPDAVEVISAGAFSQCNHLISVSLGANTESVLADAFSSCANLENIMLSDKTVMIGENAFAFCEKIKDIAIPDSTEQIQSHAFFGCINLESVITGKSLTTVGEKAFEYFETGNLILPNLKIFCCDNSFMHDYAIENEIPFETYSYNVANGSQAIIDENLRYIYGLMPGTNSLSDSIQTSGACSLSYGQQGSPLGTGTKVELIINNTAYKDYEVLIFGDINGDANIDTSDAGLIVDYENFLIEWDPLVDRTIFDAADLNGDGNIDTSDAGLIVDVENFLLTIDQTTGLTAPV